MPMREFGLNNSIESAVRGLTMHRTALPVAMLLYKYTKKVRRILLLVQYIYYGTVHTGTQLLSINLKFYFFFSFL